MAAKKLKVELYADLRNKWRTRIRARNGEIIYDSGQGVYHKSRAVDRFKKMVEELTAGNYEIVDKVTGQTIEVRDDGSPQA